jgi:hypothetical protein
MHTVHLLEEALRTAERLGYQVRHDWLGGSGGGGCQVNGRKWLFIDLALGPSDQLEQVLDTLRREGVDSTTPMADPLRRLVDAPS